MCIRDSINNIQRTDGVNFEKPSEILAKLFDAIPNIIPFAKNKYPSSGFIINYFQVNLPSLLQ